MRKICGLLWCIFIIGLVVIQTGCKKSEPKSDKLQAVATIGMIADVVKNIAGDHVQVRALMGPGVDPHLYKASEGDVSKLSRADIIFYNGLHLEAKMADIIHKMGSRTTVVAVTDLIDRNKLKSPPEFAGYHDPHVWFDVALWIQAANAIEVALIKLDPSHKADYQTAATAYRKELKALDDYIKETVKQVPAHLRVLVTAHDAFGYFGRAYNFEVVGLQGISTESKAGTKDVQRLAEFIAKRQIPAIFVESSIPVRNIKAVQAAVQSRGWDVKIGGELFADAMGAAGTEEGTYIGMVKHNVHTIVNALKE